MITEAGWSTAANGRGLSAENANQNAQLEYYKAIMNWCKSENILCFYFEAVDERWKGSDHPLEPEKHWGIFKENRTPKKVLINNKITANSYV